MAASRGHARGSLPHCDGLQHLALRAPCAHCATLGKRHPGHCLASGVRRAHVHHCGGPPGTSERGGNAETCRMTRLSLRYVRPLSACLLLALIPVVVHSYFQTEIDDCKSPRAFVPESAQASPSGGSRDGWMRERFQSSQWNEGSFFRDGLRFDFSIIRSYDAKRLYHRPENSLVEHAIVERRGIEWVQAHSGALPIHRAYYGNTDPAILVAYLLVYRSSPIASPYWPQLRAAPVQVFSGLRPMTLFLFRRVDRAAGFRKWRRWAGSGCSLLGKSIAPPAHTEGSPHQPGQPPESACSSGKIVSLSGLG